ncbi:hypothetical protein COU62_04295 [Candidatus Pacearchaeota archaeon CG10_big_fil_rev_8_21_14_0_10_35_219]|nr:hypothetical protein [Candidatus Pacearchaeota archaeon]OIO42201.1 MAG: hypothetical protein AUJ63_02880 [Candidatus Pacearchaeota archaeon CG1_02_35_32]PIO07331.1 MAG: hypothetical protein COU62_04295 [Candidatus Pacearchaeota archaeon CG10_big_fil_rev_8_21_14_0_10_35_219]PIY81381.1 MAG: hypothetical protein COY79_03840 [Candidatus Pacearchaeota archaeon CG_4_10_14_0_8_um_filter_35_169]PIZ79837.1 MAG: hypothetical protein COY00_03345 [Candidatus Pacearchaeota archaeon CG_4_10_14_0_2_um_filt
MQVIGFNFTKIQGNKEKHSKQINVDAKIEFQDISKEKLDLLKDTEAVKLRFTHILNYKDVSTKKEDFMAQILFEGAITLNVSKEESKDIIKSWKKKKIPKNATVFLYNFILRKCAPKALQLQDELGLPSHIRIPSLTRQSNQ